MVKHVHVPKCWSSLTQMLIQSHLNIDDCWQQFMHLNIDFNRSIFLGCLIGHHNPCCLSVTLKELSKRERWILVIFHLGCWAGRAGELHQLQSHSFKLPLVDYNSLVNHLGKCLLDIAWSTNWQKSLLLIFIRLLACAVTGLACRLVMILCEAS